jgi:hypothetical protein
MFPFAFPGLFRILSAHHRGVAADGWRSLILRLYKHSLLLPGHGVSTLRAFALNAGHAAFVWLLLSAFRTKTGADIASRKGSAHATSTLSTLALALSAAFSRSTASFFFHFVFLLVYAVHFLATLPASTAATRHGKSVVFQVATEPSPNDLIQIAGCKRTIWVP